LFWVEFIKFRNVLFGISNSLDVGI